MQTKVLLLSELLDWFEGVLEARDEHVGERFTFFATDERFVEFHVDADELRVEGVTNYSLPHEQWLGERDVVKIAVMGWALDLPEGSDPRYIRRWGVSDATSDIVSNVMRVFTSMYLRAHATEVVVTQRAVRHSRGG
jgi:hypothetical protein